VTLPPQLVAEVEVHLGGGVGARPLGGGCIHPAFHLTGARGEAFLKLAGGAPLGALEVEAAGLRWLQARAGGALRLPEVIARGQGEDAWLLLEWLPPGAPDAAGWEALGRGLARLHRASDGGWGWERDGYIGPLSQANEGCPDWAEFWSRRRLEPQLELARARGLLPGGSGDWDALRGALPELLEVAEREGPSPLHGDLWGGNAHPLRSGELALIDPAPYRGHREVDLVMAHLFGGFPATFFAAYDDEWPLLPGAERRRACYQLYYLLVHLNLFGRGYAARVEGALRAVLAGDGAGAPPRGHR
jgi:fructosamine-3-kinase